MVVCCEKHVPTQRERKRNKSITVERRIGLLLASLLNLGSRRVRQVVFCARTKDDLPNSTGSQIKQARKEKPYAAFYCYTLVPLSLPLCGHVFLTTNHHPQVHRLYCVF